MAACGVGGERGGCPLHVLWLGAGGGPDAKMLCGEVHVATPGGDGGRSRLSAPDGVGRYGGCACGGRCSISCCRCRRSCGPMTARAVVVVALVLVVVVGPQECVGSKDQSHKRESGK